MVYIVGFNSSGNTREFSPVGAADTEEQAHKLAVQLAVELSENPDIVITWDRSNAYENTCHRGKFSYERRFGTITNHVFYVKTLIELNTQ